MHWVASSRLQELLRQQTYIFWQMSRPDHDERGKKESRLLSGVANAEVRNTMLVMVRGDGDPMTTAEKAHTFGHGRPLARSKGSAFDMTQGRLSTAPVVML
ncbi:MAG: hypothetical protein ACRDJU_09785 [Actinomycetota bacterium]